MDRSSLIRERLLEALREIPGVSSIEEITPDSSAASSLARFNPDAAILELEFDRGLGFDEVSALKRKFSRTVLIIFTQYILPHYRTRAGETGADYFFLKSRDFNRLIQTIAELSAALAAGGPCRSRNEPSRP